MIPNKEEFEKVCKELQYEPLNMNHLGRIFGTDFWNLIVIALVDAREDALIIDKIVEQKLLDIQNPVINK